MASKPDALETELAASYERQSYAYEEGIDAQYAINAAAAKRHGRRIPNNPRFRFSDDATSGTTTSRDGFDRLRALVKSGKAPFRSVYVKDQTRLGRFDDPSYHFYFTVEFHEHGVEIRYSTDEEEVDYKNQKPGQIFPHFLARAFGAAAATNELQMTRKRTGGGTRRRVKRGFFPGAQAPYGLRRWLVHLETRAPLQEVPQRGTIRATGYAYELRWATDHSVSIVREIFARILLGQSLNSIADDLNRRGVPSPGVERGKRIVDRDTGERRVPLWRASKIHDIARNPIYCGDVLWGRTRIRTSKEPIPVEQADAEDDNRPILARDAIAKPIIRRARWLAAQRLLDGNRLAYRRRRASKAEYLLTGLVVCPTCNCLMYGHSVPKKDLRYYRHDTSSTALYARSRLAECPHRGRYIRAEQLEQPIVQLARHLLADGRLADLARSELAKIIVDDRASERATATATALERIKTLEVAIARAARNAAMAQSDTEEESYRQAAREMSAEVEHLKASIDTMDAEVARAKAAEARLSAQGTRAPTPLDVFDHGPQAARKEIIASLVERVFVDCEAGTAEVVVRAVAA